MEIAHHVADHLGGFLERLPRIESQQPHPVEDAAVHRFEPIARIGKRTIHDRGKCIGEVALFQRFAQGDLFDRAFFRGNQSFSHVR
jgi:hypothetical protein